VSYIITDIDGTLTTSGDTPRQDYIDWLKTEATDDKNIVIVSARPISRLDETRKWLNDNGVPHSQIHLNDFEGAGQGPNVGLEFKRYKYDLLVKEYGVEDIEVAVDNDADVRAMARELGLEAMTPQEAVASVEDPMEDNAIRSNDLYPVEPRQEAMEMLYEGVVATFGKFDQSSLPDGAHYAPGDKNPFKADGLMCSNCEFYAGPRGCELVAGDIDPEGICKLWVIPRTLVGGEGAPQPEEPADPMLRSLDSAEAPDDKEIIDVKELETRALPMGDFTVTEGEDGQKTFTGYAALFNVPSDGMQFTEVIAPNAFTRTLKRVADGKKMISFLFGHDETRALATTASGRLSLTEDARGLKVEAKLDPADPDAASVISKLTYEARSMGMSFGFSIPKSGDVWDQNVRTLNEINLFEVSVLSAGQTPAYPATIGLTAVRKLSADKIGVDGDRLMNTLEAIKGAQPLTEDDLKVMDQVRERLAPKPVGVDPSVALAMLQTKRLMDQEL